MPATIWRDNHPPKRFRITILIAADEPSRSPRYKPGNRGEDGAWRNIIRDLVAAVTDELDGDRDAAVGAIAEALGQVAAEPD